MGNLLSYNTSFYWEDTQTDRGQYILELNAALVAANDFGDDIYRTDDFFSITLSWGVLFEFIYSMQFDNAAERLLFPWLTEVQHQTLIGLLQFFYTTSPAMAATLEQLDEEFPNENNSLVGLRIDPLPTAIYVHNIHSWENFHRQYVTGFNRKRRVAESEYFRRFFAPQLRVSASEINRLIKRGSVHPIFKRLDLPTIIQDDTTLHGEQAQMHFTDKNKSALNIDGTWKHNHCEIPSEACEQLILWGFLLPENV
jgi:hypothetical protein